MNKVLIQLYLPVTGEKYDVRLPQSISVKQATELLSSFFSGMMGGAYVPDADSVLCDMETGVIYNVNSSVASLNLKNGSRLMLI